MPSELMTLKRAQAELRVEADELKALITAGELRTFTFADMEMLYRDDVLKLKRKRTGSMEPEQLSFSEALSELQMATAELRSLVRQGELRAFSRDGELRFRRTDVLDLKKGLDHL